MIRLSYILSFAFFLFLSLTSQAQISGYLGKKNHVGVSLNVAPPIGVVLGFPTDEARVSTATFSARLGRVIGRRTSLYAEYLSKKVSIQNNFVYQGTYNDGGILQGYTLTSKEVVLSTRTNYKLGIAPIGIYADLGVGYETGEAVETETEFVPSNDELPKEDINLTTVSMTSINVVFGMGYTFPLTKAFFGEFGFRTSFPVSSEWRLGPLEELYFDSDKPVNEVHTAKTAAHLTFALFYAF